MKRATDRARHRDAWATCYEHEAVVIHPPSTPCPLCRITEERTALYAELERTP